MKKLFFVLALSGAFVGKAYAQSSLTIFGAVDEALAYDKGSTAGGKMIRLDSGDWYQSRLGFKGTEDLGGGLKANFWLESGFSSDTGALGFGGLLFGRAAWVGLSGPAGSIKMGRWYVPLYDVLYQIEPFGASLAGDATRLMSPAGRRMDNMVEYVTPKNLGESGFAGEASYAFGNQPGSLAKLRQEGFATSYVTGALDVRVAYHTANDVTDSNTTKNTLLGGMYDFGVVKLRLLYGMVKDDRTVNQRDMMVGVSVPVGVHQFLASYVHKTDKFNANANADQLGIGFIYNLSKSTALYTSFAHTVNQKAAQYAVAVPGTSDNFLNAGIKVGF